MDIQSYSIVIGHDRVVRLKEVRCFAADNALSVCNAEIQFLANGIIPNRDIGNVRLLG